MLIYSDSLLSDTKFFLKYWHGSTIINTWFTQQVFFENVSVTSNFHHFNFAGQFDLRFQIEMSRNNKIKLTVKVYSIWWKNIKAHPQSPFCISPRNSTLIWEHIFAIESCLSIPRICLVATYEVDVARSGLGVFNK